MRSAVGLCLVLVGSLTTLPACSSIKNPGEAPNDKNTALMTDLATCHLDDVPRLLREGAQINQHERNGKTPLHYAAQCKDVSIVEALIQRGADVNAKMAGNVTPLMLSVDMAFGHPDIAMALIRAGADVNVADENGDTALIIAATESSDEVMQALLKKGANPNARGQGGDTALHYAAMNGMSDRVSLLLEHGADPDIRNSEGKSPYDVAFATNPDAAVQGTFQATRNLLIEASRGKRQK